jgi:hypothetical protein
MKYSNTGTTHNIRGGTWDTVKNNKYSIASSVLAIDNAAKNTIDPSTPDYFTATVGVDTWNNAWQSMIFKADPEDRDEMATNIIGYGCMFNIGKKDDSPGESQKKSPEVQYVDVRPYVAPAE